jgi:hypothetical protein
VSCCCLVELVGSSLNFINGSLEILMNETVYSNTKFNGIMRPVADNCSIYDYSATELYAMFTCYGGSIAATGNSFVGGVKINPSTKTITIARQTSEIGPWWANRTTGIHPTYGAYVTQAAKNAMWIYMNYFDGVGATQALKIKDTFDRWLTGGNGVFETGVKTLYILSTRTVVGYILYSSETPVFLRGVETKLSTYNWPLDLDSNWFTNETPTNIANKTFYVYIVLDTINEAFEGTIKYSETQIPDGFGVVYIGTIETDNLGIIKSDLNSVTRVGKIRVDELGNIDASSIILSAPNGKKFKVTVNNSGVLSAVAMS